MMFSILFFLSRNIHFLRKIPLSCILAKYFIPFILSTTVDLRLDSLRGLKNCFLAFHNFLGKQVIRRIHIIYAIFVLVAGK